MQFYVPEIGDEIVLAEDWTFSLFPEGRNLDLGRFFGHYILGYNTGWIEDALHPPLRDPDYNIVYPKYGESNTFFGKKFSKEFYDNECRLLEQNCPEFVKYQLDREEWNKKSKEISKPILTVTIPKGKRLKIDRIYIRKGASDYSSITFYAKDLGEIMSANKYSWSKSKPRKLKALRFWAKLTDCNRIQFENS